MGRTGSQGDAVKRATAVRRANWDRGANLECRAFPGLKAIKETRANRAGQEWTVDVSIS